MISKKIILLIIGMCYTTAYAQRVRNTKLDEHRGFKEIQLGDSFEKWSDKLTYRDSDGSTTQYVFDTNYCCNQVFEFEAELVTVLIENKKVVSIVIYLKKFQESHTSLEKGFQFYESIERQFTTLFGAHYGKSGNQTNPLIKTQWMGNKTVLETTYHYYGLKNGDAAEVSISDLDYLMKNLKSGF